MADSKRKDIVDAILAALTAISGMGKVTQDEETWARSGENLQDLPLLFVYAHIVNDERMAFPDTTADDMTAEMEVEIQGQTISQYGSSKRADVDLLTKTIETTLDQDSTLQALILDCVQKSSTIDIGSSENRGFFLSQFVVTYDYNHATP